MSTLFCRSCGNINCYTDPLHCALDRISEMGYEIEDLVAENDRLKRELTSRGLGWVVKAPERPVETPEPDPAPTESCGVLTTDIEPFNWPYTIGRDCLPSVGCSCIGHRFPGVHHMVPCCNTPHVKE